MTDTLDFLEELQADSETTSIPQDVAIKQVAGLVQDLEESYAKKERLEEALKDLNRTINDIELKKLPAIFDEISLESIELQDGTKVSVSETVTASIPKARHDEALSWFRTTGNGDIVKNELKASFGRGDDAKARQLNDFVAQHSIDATRREYVHPGTLKAFVKENLATLDSDVLSMLGAFIVKKAKIKR
mgnify:CR=1 FL=1